MSIEHCVDVTPTTSATLEHELSARPVQPGGDDTDDDNKPMLDKQEPCPPQRGRRRKLKVALAFVGTAILICLVAAGSSSKPSDTAAADDAAVSFQKLVTTGELMSPPTPPLLSPKPLPPPSLRPSPLPPPPLSSLPLTSASPPSASSPSPPLASSPSPPSASPLASPPPPEADVSAAIAAEDAAATGFFADISERLAPLNRVQLNYGVAVTDVDGDGLFEAFVCGYGAANTLIAWRGGAAADLAPALGLAAPSRQAIGVAACDMDGDGTEEIYVLNTDSYGGSKRFTDHLFRAGGAAGAAWSDLLDTPANAASRSSFAGRSVACVDRTGGGAYGVAAASYGKPLLLYEMNDRQSGAVRDVAREAGFVGTTGGRGLTGGPLYPGKDYATSPGMDVFMDNEGGASFFFRNDGSGAFREVAAELGLSDAGENGRGVALLDADADGRIDIAVGNWNGPHRLWLQPRPGAVTYPAYADAAPAAMARASPIRTVLAADFDNDGYVELFYNNICSCPHSMASMCTEPNRLFTTRDGVHWEGAAVGSAEETLGHGTGAAAYDMDGDGLLELLISHGESKAEPLSLHRVARPTAARRNHYLRVLPLTAGGAPARGALVTMRDSAGRTQVRVIDPGSGYLCQQEPVAHFGLGGATAESVTVIWPGGQQRTLAAPEVDRMHTVRLPNE